MLPTPAQLADDVDKLRKEVSELKTLVELVVLANRRTEPYGPPMGASPMMGRDPILNLPWFQHPSPLDAKDAITILGGL